MNKPPVAITLVCLLLTGAMSAAFGEKMDYNLLQSTPVGSWQLREDTTTDRKGKKTVTQMRSSLIAEVMRDGEKHYWIEMAMESFEIKRGKRKPSGDTVIIKSLVPESALQDDPANAVNNLRAFGKEIIMQSGDADPIMIRGAGGLAGSMMQAMGMKVSYEYDYVGNESVSVTAGEFPARKIQGSGATEFKMMMRKTRITSKNTAWLSDRVPFGIVKAEGETVTNGKKSTNVAELLAYGTSGASTQITKTAQELPEIPNMKQIFGR